MHHLECGLEGGSHACFDDLCLRVHGRELIEEHIDDASGLVEVNKHVVREWEEDGVDVWYHEDLRLRESGLKIVEMNRVVESDETNAGTTRTRERVEGLQYSLTCLLKHAGSHCVVGDVNHKDVDRRLRRTNHVLLRSHELNGTSCELWALLDILPDVVPVKRAVVLVRDVVQGTTNVAPPPAASVREGHERVDVGTAVAAADDAAASEIDDWNRFHVVDNLMHGLHDSTCDGEMEGGSENRGKGFRGGLMIVTDFTRHCSLTLLFSLLCVEPQNLLSFQFQMAYLYAVVIQGIQTDYGRSS